MARSNTVSAGLVQWPTPTGLRRSRGTCTSWMRIPVGAFKGYGAAMSIWFSARSGSSVSRAAARPIRISLGFQASAARNRVSGSSARSRGTRIRGSIWTRSPLRRARVNWFRSWRQAAVSMMPCPSMRASSIVMPRLFAAELESASYPQGQSKNYWATRRFGGDRWLAGWHGACAFTRDPSDHSPTCQPSVTQRSRRVAGAATAGRVCAAARW